MTYGQEMEMKTIQEKSGLPEAFMPRLLLVEQPILKVRWLL